MWCRAEEAGCERWRRRGAVPLWYVDRVVVRVAGWVDMIALHTCAMVSAASSCCGSEKVEQGYVLYVPDQHTIDETYLLLIIR